MTVVLVKQLVSVKPVKTETVATLENTRGPVEVATESATLEADLRAYETEDGLTIADGEPWLLGLVEEWNGMYVWAQHANVRELAGLALAADLDPRRRDKGTGRFKKVTDPDTPKVGGFEDLGWDHPDNDPPPPGSGAPHNLSPKEIGDIGEDLVEKHFGCHRRHREKGDRSKLKAQAKLDTLKDPNYAYEVKTRLTTSSAKKPEYRVGMKKKGSKWPDEVGAKRDWCKENGKEGGVIIVIHDVESKTSWVYVKMEINNDTIHPEWDDSKGWSFIGKVTE